MVLFNTSRRKITKLWIQSVLLQFHIEHVFLLIPARYWWPCLLVCCHVCTWTGSKVGTEGPKIFNQSSKKKRKKGENGLWSNGSLSVSLILCQSPVITMCREQQNSIRGDRSEISCMLHKEGFVFIVDKQLHIKVLIRIIHLHNLASVLIVVV